MMDKTCSLTWHLSCLLSSYICFVISEQDKSWRVRYMVANQLYELCEAVGAEPTR